MLLLTACRQRLYFRIAESFFFFLIYQEAVSLIYLVCCLLCFHTQKTSLLCLLKLTRSCELQKEKVDKLFW